MDTAPHSRLVRLAAAPGKHSPGRPVAGSPDVGSAVESTFDAALVFAQLFERPSVGQALPADDFAQDGVAQERLKLARDLHDGFLQDITAVLMQLRAAQRALQEQKQSQAMPDSHLERAILITEDTVVSMRRRVGELRQSATVQATPQHRNKQELRELCAALRVRLVSALQYSGVALDFDADADVMLPMERGLLREVLYIGGEAVANALKHGSPDRIVCTVHYLDGVVTISITDNGGGFQAGKSARDKRPAFGLAGMKERAVLLGGSLDVISTGSLGVTVRLQFPHALVAH